MGITREHPPRVQQPEPLLHSRHINAAGIHGHTRECNRKHAIDSPMAELGIWYQSLTGARQYPSWVSGEGALALLEYAQGKEGGQHER